jgi:hypothetical protein
MNTMTAPAEPLAVPRPRCPLCGEAHAPDVGCDPAWQVVHVYGFDSAAPDCPGYYVDTEAIQPEP